MNIAIFRRLLWKEFRQQWAFWVATALIILMILALASIVESMFQQKTDDFSYLGVVLALSAFYALGCGAMLFAGEHEAGTFEFQRSLPVTAFRVFLAKVVFAMVAMVAMACVLSVAAILADQYRGHSLKRPVAWWEWCLLYGYVLSLAFLWGMLFSLLIKRVLLATFLGAVVGLLCSGLGRVFVGDVIDDYFPKTVILFLFFLADLSVLIIANIWLGRRWFGARSSYIGRAAARWGLTDSPLAALDDENMQTPRTSTIVRRLAWQQWRFSRLIMGTIVLACVTLFLMSTWMLFTSFPHTASSNDFYQGLGKVSLFLAWCMVTFFGCSVFLGDQRGHSVRFLAQRAARPLHVWFSRQIVWAAPLLLIFLGFLLFCVFYFFRFMVDVVPTITQENTWYQCVWWVLGHFWRGVIIQPAEWLAIIALIFAAGQLCSMLFRSSLLAMVFGLTLSAVCAAWIAFMMLLGISPLWSVLPIAIGMFYATLLHTPNWMRDHVGWRQYLRLTTAAVMPIMVILVAIPFYRVYSIPGGGPGFDVAAFNRPETQAEKATVAMYHKASKLMEPNPQGEPGVEASQYDRLNVWNLKVSQAEKESREKLKAEATTWIEANQEVIQQALAASRQESCGQIDRQSKFPPTMTLAFLLVIDGHRLTGQGKLDLAAERYLGALRIASHLGRGITFRGGEIIEGRAYEGLRYWSAAPGQTPARIKAAIEQIDAIAKTRPSRDEAIKTEHTNMRSVIQGKNTGDGRSFSDFHGNWLSYKWNSLPWERARFLRMLDRATAQDLESLKNMGDPASFRPGMTPQFSSLPSQLIESSPFGGVNFFKRYHEGPGYFGQIAFYELNTRTARRATKIILALMAWKLEHGELPKTLDQLVGPYFKTLPTAPRAGTVFTYFPKGLPKSIWAYPPQAGNYAPHKREQFRPYFPLLVVCEEAYTESGGRNVGPYSDIPKSLGKPGPDDRIAVGFAFHIPINVPQEK